jgi:integrase
MKAKLTQSYLSTAARPDAGTTRIMDSELSGFGVDIGKSRVTFFVRRWVDGAQRKQKFGEWPAMTVSAARDAARRLLAGMPIGIEPARKGGGDAPTYGEAREAYIAFRTTTGRRLKGSTVRDMRQRLGHLSDWEGRDLRGINRADISTRHLKITQDSGPVAANGCMRYFSAIYEWAADHYVDDGADDWPANPVRVLYRRRQWNPEHRRQSFVPGADIPLLWAAIHNIPASAQRGSSVRAEVVRDWCLTMLFTGMRPGESRRLKCDSIDLRRKVFVLIDSKTRNDFYLPFCSVLESVFRRRLEYAAEKGSAYLFPAMGHHGEPTTVRHRGHFARLRSAVPGLLPGDFRRTFTTVVTNMQDAPAGMVVKRLLNHTTRIADRTDVTAGYYASDVERLRSVVDQVAKEILRLAGVRGKKPAGI